MRQHGKPSSSSTARLFGVARGGGRRRSPRLALGSSGSRRWKQILDEFVGYEDEPGGKRSRERREEEGFRETGERKSRGNSGSKMTAKARGKRRRNPGRRERNPATAERLPRRGRQPRGDPDLRRLGGCPRSPAEAREPGSRGSGSARRAQRGPARLELRGAGRGAGRRLPHPAGALPRGAAPPPESGRRSEGRAARGSAAARSAPAPVPDGFRALPGARWVFAATASRGAHASGRADPTAPRAAPGGCAFRPGLRARAPGGTAFPEPGGCP